MKDKNGSGIYAIENKKTGGIYIGGSTCMSRRWAEHRYMAKGGRHHSVKFQKAWTKWGSGAFKFSVIVNCKREDLKDKEQLFLTLVAPEYNMTDRATGYSTTREEPIRRTCFKTGRVVIYETIDDACLAGFSFKQIYRCAIGENRTHRGYNWEYVNGPRKPEFKSGIPVRSGDFKTGTIYESVHAASQSVGLSERAIRRACEEKTMCGGKRWVYHYGPFDRARAFVRTTPAGAVKIYQTEDELIMAGFEPRAVKKVCRGRRKTYMGFAWSW